MSTMSFVVRRITKDVFKILFAAFPFIIYYGRRILYHHRHNGGFFCDDKSLMLPYIGQTISSRAVLAQTILVPIGIFVLVEFFIHKNDTQWQWLVKAYTNTINFSIGYLMAVSLMWIPKFFDGNTGLRPHFFDLCRPVMPDGSTCDDVKNHGRFIMEYACSNPGYPQRIYRTFPSGHSTVSAFAVIYLIAYLQAKIRTKRYETLRLALQYLAILYGFFCPISRLYDHQHHPVDVMVGCSIGIISAVLTIKHVAMNFHYLKEVGKESDKKGR